MSATHDTIADLLDDLAHELWQIGANLDEADATAFGKLPRLLDKTSETHCRATAILRQIEAKLVGDHPYVAGILSMVNDDPTLPGPDRLREDRDERRRLAREDGGAS